MSDCFQVRYCWNAELLNMIIKRIPDAELLDIFIEESSRHVSDKLPTQVCQMGISLGRNAEISNELASRATCIVWEWALGLLNSAIIRTWSRCFETVNSVKYKTACNLTINKNLFSSHDRTNEPNRDCFITRIFWEEEIEYLKKLEDMRCMRLDNDCISCLSRGFLQEITLYYIHIIGKFNATPH